MPSASRPSAARARSRKASDQVPCLRRGAVPRRAGPHRTCVQVQLHAHRRTRRLNRFLDENSARELAVEIEPEDRSSSETTAYRDRLLAAQKQTGERMRRVMAGTLQGLPVVGWVRVRFLGGSMGSVVGELCPGWRALSRASCLAGVLCLERRRTHAGRLLSLLQMSKTRRCWPDGRCAFLVSVSPTNDRRCIASLAMLGMSSAEPRAMIGFAGRVSSSRRARNLARGFQRSEVPARAWRHRHDRGSS